MNSLALCDQLLAKGITPISYTGSTDYVNFWPLMAIEADFATDALNNIKQGKGTWMDPSIEKSFDYFRSSAEKGYFGKNYLGVNEQGYQLAFTNGKAAMTIDGSWNNTIYAKSGMNLGHFFIPNDKGEKIAQLSISNWMTYSVASKTKYPDEAALYVNFLASLEAQQIMEDNTGIPILLKDIKPLDDSVKTMSSFDKLGAQMHEIAVGCNSETSKANELLIKQVVPQLITFKITGRQACEMMDKASTYPKPKN